MSTDQLTVAAILRQGVRCYSDSVIDARDEAGWSQRTFAETAHRIDRLRGLLESVGVSCGDAVASLCWNTQQHLELYLGVPSYGAVLHTLNLRLDAATLGAVAAKGGSTVLVVDQDLLPLAAAAVAASDWRPRHVFVVAAGGPSVPDLANSGTLTEPAGFHADTHLASYEEALAASGDRPPNANIDERDAAILCFTSGTSGEPKGVAYSHRSIWLHSLSLASGAAFSVTDADRLMVIVPMFHANAWGAPFTAWWFGSDIVLPRQYVQAGPLADAVTAFSPTWASAVPTVLHGLLAHADTTPSVDLSSLRTVSAGGSRVPGDLVDAFQQRHSVRIVQGWGMTETSPLCALANSPADRGNHRDNKPDSDRRKWQHLTGRLLPGVDARIVDPTGVELPHDGRSQGELQVRGPWITQSYVGSSSPDSFADGWLRTGDVATINDAGYLNLVDRIKDVVKSGGEWISSQQLEALLISHPNVRDAAVIGVPDERWGERPTAVIVPATDEVPDAEELAASLAGHVPRWWVPDEWWFVEALPRTSVGKTDKKAIKLRTFLPQHTVRIQAARPSPLTTTAAHHERPATVTASVDVSITPSTERHTSS